MKKLSESIWANSIKRSNTDEVRSEDKFKSNINKMSPVDLGIELPILIADIDLEINGENKFTWDEVEEMYPDIIESGWRMFKGITEVQQCFYRGNQPPKPREFFTQMWTPHVQGIITSKYTNEELIFETDEQYSDSYWCYWSDSDLKRIKNGSYNNDTARGFEVGDPRDYYGCLIRTNNFDRKSKNKIRLVKDR